MKLSEIRLNAIYRPSIPLDEEVYAYIRGFKDNLIGFSVLDEATSHPDFSNCGIFWLKTEDFDFVFEEY